MLKMNDRKFMLLAIREARKSTESLRCGVMVVENGKILVKAFNSQRKDNNSTAHAEIKAISKAGIKLRDKNLENCIVYCTCKPCAMCLSALTLAKIKKLVYGISLNYIRKSIDIELNYVLSKSSHKFEVIPNFMETECKELL